MSEDAKSEVNREVARNEMTPREIVVELDRHIVGQADAKRAVAVAIRNRWRRQQLDADMAKEVYPKNIIMIGPTGVGKTEIARRLARLTQAPFVKVEASKFTEVGYHGRDVESMIRDLLDKAIALVRDEEAKRVKEQASERVNDRLLDLLLPRTGGSGASPGASSGVGAMPTPETQSQTMTMGYVPTEESEERQQAVRQRLREQLEQGKLDDREVEVHVEEKAGATMMFANMGVDQMDPQMARMLEKLMPNERKRRRMKIPQARSVLLEQETDKLLDPDKINSIAIERAENHGMIFLDEIDKIASGSSGKGGSSGGGGGGSPDVSRQGVQRDLLPIVEGSAVNTRYGVVHTDHILFVAAGAFHVAAVSDLMPELQGRFPIRVELQALTKQDFIRILTEPRGALTTQQQQLLGVEGLNVTFTDDAIDAMAQLAADANAMMENIGARRLMTIVEKVFEQINFDAPDMAARGEADVEITAEFVRGQVEGIVKDPDLSKFVL